MASNNLKLFMKNDKTFMKDVYHKLPEARKLSLWLAFLTDDFRESLYHDPLNKFTPNNYQKWKSIEKNFDRFLDVIIREDLEMLSPWYEGCGWNDIGDEINKRLGRIEKK